MKHTTLSTLSRAGGNMLRALSRQLVSNVGTLVLVALLLFAYNAGAAPQAAPPAQGATTDLLSYQGYLTDAGGSPLDGNVNVTFRLYSAPTGGTVLWTEAHTGGNAVPMSDGLFNVMLGSLTPIPSSVWDSDMLYLGVQVGNDAEMTPREMVGAVPKAMIVPDGTIGPDQIADGGVESNDLNLDHGTACLSAHAVLALNGGDHRVEAPGLTLDFSLERPSQVHVWVDGLAKFDQSSTGQNSIILYVDGGAKAGTYNRDDNTWYNVNDHLLVNLDSGLHSLSVRAASVKQGTMTVHGSSYFRTCINYLVLGEQ